MRKFRLQYVLNYCIVNYCIYTYITCNNTSIDTSLCDRKFLTFNTMMDKICLYCILLIFIFIISDFLTNNKGRIISPRIENLSAKYRVD